MHKKQRQITILTHTNVAWHETFQFSNLKIAGLAVVAEGKFAISAKTMSLKKKEIRTFSAFYYNESNEFGHQRFART